MMPLTLGERKRRRAMRKQYGKKKGDRVFWAYETKHGHRFRRRRLWLS